MHKHAKQTHKKADPLELLIKREENYLGQGINHEKKQFRGTLELCAVVDKKGVLLKYRAVGLEGNEFNKNTILYNSEVVLFNEEASIICHDSENRLSLWTLKNNIGTMARFDLSYNYSWGEAGGHFLSRSTIRMKKTS